MKKILFFASALAGLFLAASCQQENLEPVVQGGVTYEISIPEALQTKGEGGHATYDLYYEVYKTVDPAKLADSQTQPLFKDNVIMTGNKHKLSLDLLNDQDYTVLFWANKETTAYFDATNLREVKVNDADETKLGIQVVANSDDRDAFCGIDQIHQDGVQSKSVELKRPFAQINIATLVNAVDYDITPVSSEVIVKNIPVSYNVFKGEPVGDAVEVTYTNSDVPDGYLTINSKSYKKVAMNYALVPATQDNSATVEVTYDVTTANGVVSNTIPNVPVKKNYRTNIIGNLLTSKADYDIFIDADFNDDVPAAADVFTVSTDEELKVALQSEAEVINIILGADLNVSQSTIRAIGTANTEKILIDGAKSLTKAASAEAYTLNIETSYDAVVNTVNPEAQLVLKNLNLTSSKAEGTWDVYDIQFKGDVEFENVNALKSIAFVGENKTAVLKNVTISESHDYYALWISTKGMNVEWTGGAINSDGRGIKIDEQYVAQPAATTLKVTGVDFNTKAKGAIMVKSSAPVSIEVSDINIEDVAADPINAVWVDEDAEEHFDLVTVKGAIKVQEGSKDVPVVVTNAEELKAAIKAANNTEFTNIYLRPATYTGAFDIDAKSVKLIGEDKTTTIIDGLVHGLDFSHVHLTNITLTNATPATSESARNNADNYCLGAYVTDFVIEDCVFNVNNTGAAAGKGAINIYANRSDYKTSEIDGVQYDLVIRNTTFNCNGERPIRGKTNSYIEGCTFNDQYRYAIQFQGNSGLATETVTFINNKIVNPCATSGEAFAAGVSISKSQLLEDAAFNIYGNTLESTTFEDLKFVYDNHDNVKITTCTLNGTPIVAGQCMPVDNETNEVLAEIAYTYDEASKTYTVYTARGLKWVAAQVNATTPYTPTIFDDATVQLANDIDLNNEEWIPIGDDRFERTEWHGVFDGQGYKVYNVKITKKTDRDDENKSSYGLFGNVKGTVKNLTVENVSISGAPKFIGALVGRLNDGLIENCHVKNASLECNNWTIGGVVGQWNNGVIRGCSIEESTIKGYAGVGAIAGLALNTGERTLEDCSVNDCAIVANGSFGGNFDKMFGTVLGATYNGGLVVNLNKCSVENTTVKEQPSKALYGYRAEGDVVKINGTVINDDTIVITTAEELVAATTIKAGQTVVLMSDIDLSGVEFGGLSAFHPENNNTFDGLGHTVSNWTNESGASDMGFIKGWVGTIKNVTLKNVHLKTSGRSAILAGNVYSNIDNCHLVECTLEDSYWACGLIAGLYNSGNITNCSVDGCNVQSNGGTGGIVGVINESAGERNVENCVVKNTTVNNLGSYGESYSGGLVCGMLNADSATYRFNNCTLENNTKEGNYVGDLFYSAGDETVYVDGVQQ